MLARLPSNKERDRVIGILLSYTNDRKQHRQTIACSRSHLAMRDGKLRPLIRGISKAYCHRHPAMRARGKHLLAELNQAR